VKKGAVRGRVNQFQEKYKGNYGKGKKAAAEAATKS
jgi:hypothetical protein